MRTITAENLKKIMDDPDVMQIEFNRVGNAWHMNVWTNNNTLTIKDFDADALKELLEYGVNEMEDKAQ
jgi:hypothetical protein